MGIPANSDELLDATKRSAYVKHNGGVIPRTGLVFAEGGEVILPKVQKFAAGSSGPVGLEGASYKVEIPKIKVDAEELINELNSIILKVEDKTLAVEDTVLAVEDKVIKVDVPDSIQVEQPDWKVAVDVPTDTIQVTIDATNAATTISDSIKNALNTTIKVETTGTTNAVGGDRLNEVAQAIASVNDKVIGLSREVASVKMLGNTGANNETIDIDRKVNSIVDTKLAGVNRNLDELRNAVSDVSATQRQKDVYRDSQYDDLDRRLRNAFSFIGTGRPIGGI